MSKSYLTSRPSDLTILILGLSYDWMGFFEWDAVARYHECVSFKLANLLD